MTDVDIVSQKMAHLYFPCFRMAEKRSVGSSGKMNAVTTNEMTMSRTATFNASPMSQDDRIISHVEHCYKSWRNLVN